MTTRHTPEPWKEQEIPVTLYKQADYDRARSCVNGCAGLNPEAYRQVVEALQALMDAPSWEAMQPAFQQAREALANAKGQ